MSLAGTVTNRINHIALDSVFSTKDFLALGDRLNINNALSSLCKRGVIQRIANGIYYKPLKFGSLGNVPPKADQIIQAIMKRTGEVICMTGVAAANTLGLSNQVQGRAVYLTTGRSRKVKAGDSFITLQHTSIKPFDDTPNSVILIIHALNSFGKDNIDDYIINRSRKYLKNKDFKYLRKMSDRVPYWLKLQLLKILDQ
jgi:hypothetical protein